MKYCTRCLYPANHPLGITFDENGVCSGCRVHEEKDRLDWDLRGKELAKLLNHFKNRDGKNYDCIIPVSGGRDSYFIVHTIKNLYKLNPLLVTYNKHYNTSVGIRNLAYLKTLFDCDLLTLTTNPQSVKNITRVTLQELGSVYWHCIAGQTVFPVQIAVRLKIPLIIWGAHQGIDQVGMFSHLDEVEMTRKYRKDHDLMGLEAEDLLKKSPSLLTYKDIIPFTYPDDREIEKVGVRGIYLNNFIRWDTKRQHEDMIKLYGYETSLQTRTFDTYNDVDCYNYSDVHDYIKFLKFGYGKVTDHATREIRLKRISREDGIALVEKYQNIKPKNLDLILNWLKITENGLYFYVNQRRDRSIWSQSPKNNKWMLNDSVINHLKDFGVEEARLSNKSKRLDFKLHKRPKAVDTQDYILVGKGFIS